MSSVPHPAQERAYPILAPADDRRFTLGLVFAVAQVLVDHGFPPITAGGDLVELQQALYGFIYRPLDERLAEPPGGPVPPGVEGHRQTGRGDDGACSCGDEPDPNCRVHASRFRRPCGDPAPHSEHPWVSPAVLGSAPWTCPGVNAVGGVR